MSSHRPGRSSRRAETAPRKGTRLRGVSISTGGSCDRRARLTRSEHMRHLLKLSIPAIAAPLLIAACGSSSSSNTTSSAASTQPATQTSSSSSSALVVKTASSSLGTILVDSQGMTLYHLGGEVNGKFICTSTACLGVWHPLIASAGSKPSGEVGSLGTVKRPEGTMQVTYKGTPLYTFTGDQQPGETKGQGSKTWAPGASSRPAPAVPLKRRRLLRTEKVEQRRLRLLSRPADARRRARGCETPHARDGRELFVRGRARRVRQPNQVAGRHPRSATGDDRALPGRGGADQARGQQAPGRCRPDP